MSKVVSIRMRTVGFAVRMPGARPSGVGYVKIFEFSFKV